MDDLTQFLEALRGLEGIDDGDLALFERMARGEEQALVPAEAQAEPDTPLAEEEAAGQDLRAKIALLNVPERLKLAMFGNSICRALLVLDSSRLVQLAVLNNPRLTLGEVEAFGKNTNVSSNVLRVIAENRQWLRSYLLKYNLVTNPRTPQDVALKWLRYLRKAELRRVAQSKNVPQIVAITARKILATQEKA